MFVRAFTVCDASVIGRPVIGHSDGPTRMVGQNCANMIMDDYRATLPSTGYGTNVKMQKLSC